MSHLITQQDTEALIEGVRDGTIDAIATDHAPHTTADKEGSLAEAAFGISGLETALGVLMSLVQKGSIDLPTLLLRLTFEPAKIAGKHTGPLGTLSVGAPADVTIIDPDAEWIVSPTDFAPQGKNTPWAGDLLRGKIAATIHRGRIVYEDD
jgi:dihydroorotase